MGLWAQLTGRPDKQTRLETDSNNVVWRNIQSVQKLNKRMGSVSSSLGWVGYTKNLLECCMKACFCVVCAKARNHRMVIAIVAHRIGTYDRKRVYGFAVFLK